MKYLKILLQGALELTTSCTDGSRNEPTAWWQMTPYMAFSLIITWGNLRAKDALQVDIVASWESRYNQPFVHIYFFLL